MMGKANGNGSIKGGAYGETAGYSTPESEKTGVQVFIQTPDVNGDPYLAGLAEQAEQLAYPTITISKLTRSSRPGTTPLLVQFVDKQLNLNDLRHDPKGINAIIEPGHGVKLNHDVELSQFDQGTLDTQKARNFNALNIVNEPYTRVADALDAGITDKTRLVGIGENGQALVLPFPIFWPGLYDEKSTDSYVIDAQYALKDIETRALKSAGELRKNFTTVSLADIEIVFQALELKALFIGTKVDINRILTQIGSVINDGIKVESHSEDTLEVMKLTYSLLSRDFGVEIDPRVKEKLIAPDRAEELGVIVDVALYATLPVEKLPGNKA